MDATLRRATEIDVPDLARLHIIAAHGIVDALYHDLVPGRADGEARFEWRFTQAGSVKSYEYCWVGAAGLANDRHGARPSVRRSGGHAVRPAPVRRIGWPWSRHSQH